MDKAYNMVMKSNKLWLRRRLYSILAAFLLYTGRRRELPSLCCAPIYPNLLSQAVTKVIQSLWEKAKKTKEEKMNFLQLIFNPSMMLTLKHLMTSFDSNHLLMIEATHVFTIWDIAVWPFDSEFHGDFHRPCSIEVAVVSNLLDALRFYLLLRQYKSRSKAMDWHTDLNISSTFDQKTKESDNGCSSKNGSDWPNGVWFV